MTQPARSRRGAAVSDVLERGFNAEVPTKWENGILIFSPGPAAAVTAEHVMKLKDDLEANSIECGQATTEDWSLSK
jgi:hypothetical protein